MPLLRSGEARRIPHVTERSTEGILDGFSQWWQPFLLVTALTHVSAL